MNRRDLFKKLSTGVNPDSSSELAITLPPYRSAANAGSPRQYAKGDRVLITSARAWLCYDEIGFYAVEAYCPHLGCLVRPAESGFVCPCHQSRFAEAGARGAGPTPRGLRYLYVDLDNSGCLVICRDRTVNPDDRLIA